jgi:hypothetical protein
VALTRGPAENRAGRKHDFQAPSRFYGNDGTKFPKNCLGTLLAKTGKVAKKGRQILTRSHNETLSVAAMCVNNEDDSPIAIRS